MTLMTPRGGKGTHRENTFNTPRMNTHSDDGKDVIHTTIFSMESSEWEDNEFK